MITGRWMGDPGPCPVDDSPHTTCCSPDYQPIVIAQLPCRDGVPAPCLQTPIAAPGWAQVPQPAVTPFTTKAYRRRVR
jgi:hypothetical protein